MKEKCRQTAWQCWGPRRIWPLLSLAVALGFAGFGCAEGPFATNIATTISPQVDRQWIPKSGEFSTQLPSRPEKEGQQFLRYPLQFTRISSEFSPARFHPILKRTRPHLGVDFAAPRGTPVRAVADGRVQYAGWRGGLGRFVRLDHPGPYDSGYGHLQRIAKGVRGGSTVKQGQIIGYVGSTGLATGPHLHYVLYKHGEHINPLMKQLPRTQGPVRLAKPVQDQQFTQVRLP